MLFSPRSTSLTNDASMLAELHQLHQIVISTRDSYVLAQAIGRYSALAAYRTTRPSTTTLRSATSSPYEAYLASTSLRIQTSMSQLTAMESTITNIMKKTDESSKAIISNIK